jgi:predicted N-acetyltransferase YhbS
MTSGTRAQVDVRLLRDDDIAAAEEMSSRALDEVDVKYGMATEDRDAARIAGAQQRIRHLAGTDPEGSVVAERDGEIVGVGLAIRRGSLWFLSLMAVRSDVQGAGIGRRLMDATLDYGKGCALGMICASPDPRALRRYGRAGFALHAGFQAEGVADRTELPAGLGVREGDWERDVELVESLVSARRGEPYGPDLGLMRRRGTRLLVRDGPRPQDRAMSFVRGRHVAAVAADSDDAARRVLWAALAEAPGAATVSYLVGNQQWAIEVALAARLELKPTEALAIRGMAAPPSPYLPTGAFG